MPAAARLIVLASSSPYRKMLLQRLRLRFTCYVPDIDETPFPRESPRVLVRRLAKNKAVATCRHFPDALIIGSDQVAVCGGKMLGKPGNRSRAHAQLQSLSGRQVRFYTGLCVLNGETGAMQADVISYKVKFRKLASAEIDRYLAADRPYNCAGSFKSEGLGISLLACMQGDDPTALVGLPLIRLREMLGNESINVP